MRLKDCRYYIKLVRVLLLALFALMGIGNPLFSEPLAKQDKDNRYTTQIPNTFLWKVSHADDADISQSSYLLGTVHIGKEGAILPDSLSQLLSGMDGLTIEVNPTEKELSQVGATMLELEGGLLKLLDERYIDKFIELLNPNFAELGIELTPEMVDRYKPWGAYMALLQLTIPEGYSSDFGLDHLLKEQADQEDIPVYQLEELEDSLVLFSELPEPYLIESLKITMDHFDDDRDSSLEMVETYQADDAQALYDSFMDRDKALQYIPVDSQDFWWNWFVGKVVIGRNNAWMIPLEERISIGNQLIAVGAGHLYGENGLLQLLDDRGYQLTPVLDLELIEKSDSAIDSEQK